MLDEFISPVFCGASATLNVAGFILYFHRLSKGKAACFTGWFLSFVIATAAAVSHFSLTGNLAQSGSYFVGAIFCGLICLFSLKGGLAVGRPEVTSILVALAVGIFVFLSPRYSVYGIAIYNLLLYSVFLRNIQQGNPEQVMPWLIWIGAALSQLAALLLSAAQQITLLLPIVNLICWSSVAVLAIRNNNHTCCINLFHLLPGRKENA